LQKWDARRRRQNGRSKEMGYVKFYDTKMNKKERKVSAQAAI
jgi:hypothetical protein